MSEILKVIIELFAHTIFDKKIKDINIENFEKIDGTAIRPAKYVLWLGLIGTFFFTLCLFFAHRSATSSWWTQAIFLVLAVLNAFFILYYLVIRHYFDMSGLYYKTVFGRKILGLS